MYRPQFAAVLALASLASAAWIPFWERATVPSVAANAPRAEDAPLHKPRQPDAEDQCKISVTAAQASCIAECGGAMCIVGCIDDGIKGIKDC